MNSSVKYNIKMLPPLTATAITDVIAQTGRKCHQANLWQVGLPVVMEKFQALRVPERL
jgi:hypothetical protein